MPSPPIYTGFQPCPTLLPKMKCIRLRRYNHGQGDPFTELFHEHFPGYRMSEDASTEMMKALVLRYEEVEAPHILRCYLNKRGHDPKSSSDLFTITVEYPEPGVMRKYCGTDIQAWIDTVIDPKGFRQ
jgi:hypothetical protein